MLHKKQYYGVNVNKSPSTLYKPSPAVKKVNTSKTEQNKNIKCEICDIQGQETSTCWSGTKKASKDNSFNKTLVKFSQSDSKNKNQNNGKNYKQSSNKKGRGRKRNQGGRVNQVTYVNQLPPSYAPTHEEENEEHGFQSGLDF